MTGKEFEQTVTGRNFLESLADIAGSASGMEFYSGDSRYDIDIFISLAIEFEALYINETWENLEYLDTIWEFAERRLTQIKTLPA